MGSNCCKTGKVPREKLSLLLVGLDNAGKTVTVRGLAGEAINSPIPTVGFAVTNLKYSHYDVRIFDLGGGPGIRGIWHNYFVNAHGIIFVVDSSDTDRFVEVRETLQELLCHPKISGKPLLILANKQDQESALDEIDIIECLLIETLANKYKCPTLVQSCSASVTNINKLDVGVKLGYDWIMNFIDKNFDELNVRVQMDIVEQELREKEEMVAKIQRIKAERQALMQVQDPDVIQTYSEYVSKLNGEANKALQVVDIDINPEVDYTSDLSESSLTFPAIYHVQSASLERERPKSAIQLVKHQLQMNNNALRRSQSAKLRRNKTAPAKTFHGREFVPSSAKEPKRPVTLVRPLRNLHSADARIFSISGRMGPGGDYYSPGIVRDVFQVGDDVLAKSKSALTNGKVKEAAEPDRLNGICVVDIA
ncbi:hypothetical protein GWI33_022994 [Rhynchophorus ferrugineus]|uniref:ADP-ribosylation factor-like protein 13B n=1 Tax=Rhynchophorus ferrugineus TaxID=354439 RepID=A0A834IRJ0_RHYFE|nr:hypothetical protein GWI33_022994 [Rhynchophorus ferrugineus]